MGAGDRGIKARTQSSPASAIIRPHRAPPVLRAVTADPPPEYPITHNLAARRFETRVDGWLCRADYLVDGERILLVHTEVAPAVEGRGVAAALVRAALAWAESDGRKVVPRCSFVRVYLQRHPEYAHLLA